MENVWRLFLSLKKSTLALDATADLLITNNTVFVMYDLRLTLSYYMFLMCTLLTSSTMECHMRYRCLNLTLTMMDRLSLWSRSYLKTSSMGGSPTTLVTNILQ